MTTTASLLDFHRSAIAELNKPDFDDGTYELATLKPVEFSKGYQVTFCQVGDDYSHGAYEYLVNLFRENSSDGKVYLGKFEGEPEVSFHFSVKKTAIRFAKAFNQISIWDWKACDEIKTGGTGKR